VRDVDDAHHAEDEREAARNQKQQGRREQPVERLRGEVDTNRLLAAAGPSRATAGSAGGAGVSAGLRPEHLRERSVCAQLVGISSADADRADHLILDDKLQAAADK